VDGILGLLFGESLVQIARSREVARLHAGVGEKFVDFRIVRLVARLVKQLQNFLECWRIAAQRSDYGAQGFQHLGRVVGQQPIGALLDDMNGIFLCIVL
jgi:hypothetical protein